MFYFFIFLVLIACTTLGVFLGVSWIGEEWAKWDFVSYSKWKRYKNIKR